LLCDKKNSVKNFAKKWVRTEKSVHEHIKQKKRSRLFVFLRQIFRLTRQELLKTVLIKILQF
jgi:hypothetical protein